jgi:hypothetical protein
MALTVKLLADGQLAASKTTIYTVPAATTTTVVTIVLVNTGAGDNSVNLYVNNGTSRRIIPKDTTLVTGNMLETDRPYTLEAGDLIEGDATNATEVDYTIHGVERT